MEADSSHENQPAVARALPGSNPIARAAAATLIATLLGILVWSWWHGGIVATLLSTSQSAADKIDALRHFFARLGPAAPLAYVLFVILEVVIAPLPGAMLYAPGGILFGGFLGGLLSLTGNVIGAGLACQLMRTFLGPWARHYFLQSGLGQYEERISRQGAWIVYLLRLNPLTSSDLVSYAAGLTRLSVWKLMLATMAGMAPLCFAQSYFANGVLAAFPSLVYPLVIACLIYAALAIWILATLLKPGRPLNHESPAEASP